MLLFALSLTASAQGVAFEEEVTKEENIPPFRVAALIGHTVVPAEHAGTRVIVPSWGLDLEYWFGRKWGVGLHSDIELESFVIIRQGVEEEELERIRPVVITLDALYNPWKGLILQLGPGIEFERTENFAVVRAGVEYEVEIGHGWDLAPTFFYDSRFDEYHTWTFALPVGKRF